MKKNKKLWKMSMVAAVLLMGMTGCASRDAKSEMTEVKQVETKAEVPTTVAETADTSKVIELPQVKEETEAAQETEAVPETEAPHDLSAMEMKQLAETTAGKMCDMWDCEDYNNDGKEELFATLMYDESSDLRDIVLVTSDGKVSTVMTGTSGYVVCTASEGDRVYLLWSQTGDGMKRRSYMFGVDKNNKLYQPDLSGNCMDLYPNEADGGYVCYYVSDGGNVEHRVVFNSKTRQFEEIRMNYLNEYYEYLSGNDWIYQYDGNADGKKMAVLDMNEDGILEVALQYEGTEWGNYTTGWLTYNGSMLVELDNSLENDEVGTTIDYVNTEDGTFMTGRTRGKNYVDYMGLYADGSIGYLIDFDVCYWDDEEIGWDDDMIRYYNDVVESMAAPVWVTINKQNLERYLSGDGMETGVDYSNTPYQLW